MTAHFALHSTRDLLRRARPLPSTLEPTENILDGVTPRQLEIMMKLCEGKVNKQIAYELGVTTATVKAHIRFAIKRLGAKNRVHAVAMVAANAALHRPQRAAEMGLCA
ncbi:MAG: helix-turn-helix domain-containing protein [Labrenzia sp.]